MKSQQFGFGLAFALAAAVAASACGNNKAYSRTPEAAATARAAGRAIPERQQPSIALTGCLQQGIGDMYILTTLNPSETPDSSNPAVVERERLAVAQDAYRLTSGNDENLSLNLERLVGKQVRVHGTLTETSDLTAQSNAGSKAVATSGQKDKTSPRATGTTGEENITQNDLAKVLVSSVQQVAPRCDGKAGGRS